MLLHRYQVCPSLRGSFIPPLQLSSVMSFFFSTSPTVFCPPSGLSHTEVQRLVMKGVLWRAAPVKWRIWVWVSVNYKRYRREEEFRGCSRCLCSPRTSGPGRRPWRRRKREYNGARRRGSRTPAPEREKGNILSALESFSVASSLWNSKLSGSDLPSPRWIWNLDFGIKTWSCFSRHQMILSAGRTCISTVRPPIEKQQIMGVFQL